MYNKEIFLISVTDNLLNLAEGGLGGDYSKFWSEERKNKHRIEVSNRLKKYYKTNSTHKLNAFLNKNEEELAILREKWSECKKGLKNWNAKYPQKILQIKDGVVIREWDNVYQVRDELGYRILYIIKCAKKYKGFYTHKGYSWQFKNEL